ncbi:MAG: DUF4292 domain-containing protein [Myxococcota bacterium]
MTADDVLAKARAYLASGPAHAVLEARASQYSDQGGIKGKVEIILSRPGRVRFSGLSPTDDLVSVLVTDGERFTAFERGKKTCYVGRACPANVGRFTGFPLEADDLVGVLLGRPPIVPVAEASFTWDRQVGAYRVDVVGSAASLGGAKGEIQRLWVGHADGRILRMQVKDGDKTRADVQYSEWRTVDGHVLPGRIDVHMARDHVDLRIDYRDFDLAAPVDANAFVFECPAGTTLEEQPCY